MKFIIVLMAIMTALSVQANPKQKFQISQNGIKKVLSTRSDSTYCIPVRNETTSVIFRTQGSAEETLIGSKSAIVPVFDTRNIVGDCIIELEGSINFNINYLNKNWVATYFPALIYWNAARFGEVAHDWKSFTVVGDMSSEESYIYLGESSAYLRNLKESNIYISNQYINFDQDPFAIIADFKLIDHPVCEN